MDDSNLSGFSVPSREIGLERFRAVEVVDASMDDSNLSGFSVPSREIGLERFRAVEVVDASMDDSNLSGFSIPSREIGLEGLGLSRWLMRARMIATFPVFPFLLGKLV